ncbi:MAG: beta-galactosidase, partial [Candidatus Sulfotelmatobacter sp.]
MRIKAAHRTRALPVLFGLLCVCLSAAAAQQPAHTNADESRLPAVQLDGNYFSRAGHRFIPVGANWVPAKAAMQWPIQWDPKAIEADFARMHELGFNTIRLDFVWAWIEPRTG